MAPMEHHGYDGVGDGLTKSGAVAACTAMAVFYVAIIFSPTLVLRLPQPTSQILYDKEVGYISSTWCLWHQAGSHYRKETDYLTAILIMKQWQALIYPVSLTSCMYMGTFVRNLFSVLEARNEYLNIGGNPSLFCKKFLQRFINQAVSTAYSISSWRNYFVAPLTEELVFRACMIPLLLCGGFSTYIVVSSVLLFQFSSSKPLLGVLCP